MNLRLTHPTLYHSITMFAVVSVGLAVSYWFGPPPTFNPYDINRDLVASLFFLYGVWQFIFLNVHRLRMVRLGLAFAFVLWGAWGWANTIQVFAGKASWAFPIAFGGIAGAHLIWLTESPVNPMTQREEP